MSQHNTQGRRSGGRGVNRYVEACLLLLLAERPAHGLDLQDRLPGAFPIDGQVPDVSTIYRALAELEAQGAIISQWGPGEGGGRKVHELTDAGRDLLRFWIDRFEIEQAGIARYLKRARKKVQRT
jgi:DNA-binding PadR family transcriptional regulator